VSAWSCVVQGEAECSTDFQEGDSRNLLPSGATESRLRLAIRISRVDNPRRHVSLQLKHQAIRGCIFPPPPSLGGLCDVSSTSRVL
jgi:hypothetical protein